MGQLKDLLVTGPSRLIGDAYVNKIQITAISAPASAGGTTYGLGTDGQALMSSSTGVYWGTISTSDVNVTQTITTTSAAYRLLFSNTADDTTRTETARKAAALYYNPATKLLTVSGGQVTATTFNGWLNGTAATAAQATHAATANFATTATRVTGAIISTTTNAIAKYSTATGTFANSGVTIDANNNITAPTTAYLKVGNITIGGTSASSAYYRISSSSTLYLNRGNNTSIIFQHNGTNKVRIDTADALRPEGNNVLSLGTTSNWWATAFATTYYGSLAGTAAYAASVDWANVTNVPTISEIEFVNWNSV